ncbi:pPIWI_RE module domain-containing protein [Streptomyces sp. NPDC051555]|uniref:pPIWI_RE module domain-containing protein n=1 Tax=Streptomyces sp. NPDC051555 TaxID=3365657 RepID=UPI0037AC21ED
MYQTIRTTAYEADPAHGPWLVQPSVLAFGPELHTRLTGLYARGHTSRAHTSRDHPLQLPVRRLNTLLSALAPGVIATAKGVGADGRVPWLYAREPVPREVIAALVGSWAAGFTRGSADTEDADADAADDAGAEEELFQVLESVTDGLQPWRTEPLDLTESSLSPGGTAEPARQLYGLLPEWIAFRLAERPYRAQGSELNFRVVSTDTGVDLVSWPPQQYEHRKRSWYYSALVGITVHTVPFTERFRVHVSTSIRRWATSLSIRPREFRGATVLLDAPLPWPDGPDKGHRLIGNGLYFDRGRRQLAWRRRSPSLLLPELDIVRRYPEPDELFQDPGKWLRGSGDIAAGIVYSPVLGTHEVGSGLMPKERSQLDAWVEEGLRPMMRRIPDLTRVTRSNTPSLLPRPTTPDARETREAQLALGRREALAATLGGGPLEIDVFWQSPRTVNALLTALPELIGLPPGIKGKETTAESWRWQAPGIDVTVRAQPAGSVAEGLDIPGKGPRSVRFAESAGLRCAMVADRVPPLDGARGLAIIELADKERFHPTDTDPKHALRIACARTGRLSQFINLREDADELLNHRARWTWLDAFRQLGATAPPAHRVGAGIPGDLQYVGLWLVRYTRKGPTRCAVRRLVAVRVRPDGARGAIDGWDPARAAWVPYPELMLSLAAVPDTAATVGTIRGSEQQWQAEAERQIRTLLYQLRDRPTLLVVNSGNLRQCWPGLYNGALVRDGLGFGSGPGQRLAVHGPDLRVVLTRDKNGREEVPEWYAHDGKDKVGFAKGVWGLLDPDQRVFASTADVPHTATLPKGLMKLAPTAQGRTAPGKTAWNPLYLELTVLGCLSEQALKDAGREDVAPDRPAEWATLVHQLRFHDDYVPLARPLPLHLAKLAAEYVLPLAPEHDPAGRTEVPTS